LAEVNLETVIDTLKEQLRIATLMTSHGHLSPSDGELLKSCLATSRNIYEHLFTNTRKKLYRV